MSLKPRSRTKGGFVAAPGVDLWQKATSCANKSTFTFTSSSSAKMSIGSFESMTDYVVPGFRARQGRGEIFFNDMQQDKVVSSLQPGANGYQHTALAPTITCDGIGYVPSNRNDGNQLSRWVFLSRSYPDGPLPVSYSIGSSDVYNLQSEVSTKCFAKRGTAGSNLFESIAQARQTLSLIRNPFNSLNRICRKAETARSRGLGAAEAWLTYRYGVLPLIGDIGQIASGLKKKVEKRRYKSIAVGSSQTTSTNSYTFNGGPASLTFSLQNRESIEVRAISLDEYVMDQYESIGLSTKDLITLPWELIPYSFVFDWFVNFGDFLKAIVPLPGVNPLGSCLVTTRLAEVFVVPTVTTNNNVSTHNQDRSISGALYASRRTKTRSALIPPRVVLKSDFKLDDATRLADATSLLMLRLNRIFT